WESFVEAWLSTNTCASASMEVPDFSVLTEVDFDAVMSDSGFSPDQTKRLKESTDKHKTYVRMMTWKMIAKAGNDIQATRLLLRKQRIFMPKVIRDEFESGLESMTRAFVGKKLAFQDPRNFREEAVMDYLETHVTMFEKVADAANSRLFREEVRDGGESS
ncbi:MAG: hypothetical protein JSS22_14960, partial [Proteobacteria bacterium]|nr:hypothetical protein [Pseudomonadota bacterium]